MPGRSGNLPRLRGPQAAASPGKLGPGVFFTLDLEDHLGIYNETSRFIPVVYRLLDLLDESDAKGTFFTVGRACTAAPALMREIAARGHEVACHSYEHRRLDQEDPRRFRLQTAAAKDQLEQASGSAVTGFRAPFFSLIPSTVWTLEILAELGFVYSSSLIPGDHPLCGFPGAPREPFRWPNGLIELPCPIARIGRFALPFLGGPYLRYLPGFLVSHLMARHRESACLWTYCHPYDFDAGEPYARIPDVPALANLMLWLNRRQMFNKTRRLLRNASLLTLAQLVARPEFQQALPEFSAGEADISGRDGSAYPESRMAGIRGHNSADSRPA